MAGVRHIPLPSGSSCANGTVCDGAELCNSTGTCQPGTPPNVNDGNPCTTDSCDPQAGVLHVPVSAGTSCSDASACNGSEICNGAGTCAPGIPPPIDDSNPCTADSCDPVTGVAHIPLPSGTACADADLCNGSELCNATGVCVLGTPSNIDDGNPCTADSCNPVTGTAHVPVPAGTACADTTVCNGAELCNASAVCQAGTPLNPDDQNPCTTDACDPVAGVAHSPVSDGTACNDGDGCTHADSCQAGSCAGADPVVCTAQTPCHAAGSCDPTTGLCSNPALADGAACDDEDACTLGEICTDGSCGVGIPIDVDDGNPCTADSCDSLGGALHTPVAESTSCDDANLCNGPAACDASGVCQPGTPLTCEDGNACNGVAICQPATGCVTGTPPSFDDGNSCTADSCDPVAGVHHNPVAVGTSCSDGDECNGSETCNGSGFCQLGAGSSLDDGNPCTVDSCDPLEGVVHIPASVGTACNPDACTIGATCDIGGFCVGGTSIVPDDGDPCTIEWCDPEVGPQVRTCEDVDRTVTTNVFDAMSWYFSGADPVQQGVVAGAIALERAAVVSGQVLQRGGATLAGALVSVLDHPELGFAITRDDGRFDLVVNGGGTLVLGYEKHGYLSAQRQVDVDWNAYARARDVVLIEPDPVVSPIELDMIDDFEVAMSSPQTDADGERQGVLLVPAGTEATMHLSDGTEVPIDSMNVRITEFTVGESGPETMPGALPPVSGYTYAFEVNADEAIEAGAPEITFSQPLVYYVENFLGFPAGTSVPLGSYDRTLGTWKPEESGIVLTVVSETGNRANVDVTGDGVADTSLASFGMTDLERGRIADLYEPGQSLWRVRLRHFTQPWDCNWPFSPPDDAEPPPPSDRGTGDDDDDDDDEPDEPDPGPNPPDPCGQQGSIIECETLTLRERVPVAGTPHMLNYTTDRVPGRRDSYRLKVHLSGAAVPATLKHIELEVQVANRTFEGTFPPAPNQSHRFEWDGRDAFGRLLQGRQPARVTVRYLYDGVYENTGRFGDFGNGVEILGSRTREEIALERVWDTTIGTFSAPEIGLGAWMLDAHHSYDVNGRVLYRGDGTRRVAEYLPPSLERIAGGGTQEADGAPASSTRLRGLQFLVALPDGSYYVTSGVPPSTSSITIVRHVDTAGIIRTVAGNGSTTVGGDGGPALAAGLGSIKAIDTDAAGNLYILAANRVRRVGRDGIVQTVAGTGAVGSNGDGGPATSASLDEAQEIAIASDGSLYISEVRRVRRVNPSGIITTVAGNGTTPFGVFAQDGQRAVQAPLFPTEIAAAPDGTLYIGDSHGQRIHRLELDGTLTHFAGCGVACSGSTCGPACPSTIQDGRSALQSRVNYYSNITVMRDGTLVVAHFHGETTERILEIDRDGILRTVHSQELNDSQDDVVLTPDGSVLFTLPNAVHRLRPALPGLHIGAITVASDDTDEVYVFDYAGRHHQTRHALTGAVLWTFEYSTAGLLVRLIDSANNVTTIERNAIGRPVAIVGPYGQRTTLGLDGNGYLSSITDPLNQSVTLASRPDGLLESFTDPGGGTSVMSYDSLGRLVSQVDAGGGVKQLTPAGERSVWSVDFTTPEGHTTSYGVETLASGDELRTTLFPDGTGAEDLRLLGFGQRVLTLPDGTTITNTMGGDPRFAVQRPLTSAVTTLPSGLSRSETVSRTATLSDPTNPLSLVSEVTTTDINGKDWVTTYTSSNRRTATVSPVGRWSRGYVDAQGRLMRRELPNTLPVDFTYDTRGRLRTTTQGTRIRTNTYFSTADGRNGYIANTANALNQLTTYERDAVGRVLDRVAPDNTVTSLDWDPKGNLIGLTPPGKPEHTQSFTPVNLQDLYSPPVLPGVPDPSTSFAFNLDRQPTITWRPNGLFFERVYDDAGKLDFIEIPGGTIDYNYFGVSGATPGALASIAHPSGVELAYTYDGHVVTGTSWSGSVSGGIQWSYNKDFRVTTETVNTASAPAPIAFAYDSDGLQTCASPTTCPSGAGALRVTRDPLLPRPTSSISGAVTDTFAYNTYGELASYSASASGTIVYRELLDTTAAPRDALGRIAQRSESSGGVTTTYSYKYDPQGRLSEVREGGDLVDSYTYDDNGNRLTFETAEVVVSATYDDQDRLLTYGDFDYTYTANGELLTKTDTSNGDITEYEYDVFGNLVRVDLPNGDVIEYLVDGQNRRVGKLVNGTLEKQWLWASQLRIAAELDGAGHLVSRFVYGHKPTTPDLVISGTAVYRVISDHLGSVRALVNINDPTDVPVRLDYEAFGSASGTGVGVIPQGFAGGLYDAETGLMRFGARDYEPAVGRWVSKDPIRFDATGTNLYAYALGDPVNVIDANGRNPIVLIGICAGGGCEALAAAAAGVLVGAALLGDAIGDVIDDLTDASPVCDDDGIVNIGGEGRELDRISRDRGIPREQLRKALEKIKKAARLRGNENVDVLPDGTVVDPVSGDPIGNIYDEQGD